MRARRSLARRSAFQWFIRGLLAVIAIAVGYASVTRTLANVLRGRDVEKAHSLAPEDGRITATFAATRAGAEAIAVDRARAAILARRALRQDPTVVAAAVTLGINAQIRGDTTSARRLFAYAETLSRRDLQTQLWFIEDSVGRGDVAGALSHYDIALRTSRGAQDLLFPVLASAIADRAVRSALVKALAGTPGWGASFIDYVAVSGPNPRATASLFHSLAQARVPVSQGAQAATINGLVAGGFVDIAWSYYASVRPSAQRSMSRDPHFVAELASPSLFDWTPINDAGVTTSIQRGDKGGVFDFVAPPSVGGALLRQMQVLPPDRYALKGHSAEIDQAEDASPYWTLACLDGRELGRVAVSNSAQAGGVFAGSFNVPAACPVQILTLVGRPSSTVSGLVGQIDQVQLYPLR